MRQGFAGQIAGRGIPDFGRTVGAPRGNVAAIIAERAVENFVFVLELEARASARSVPNQRR